jgi:small nuclear ribonucleoprotein F
MDHPSSKKLTTLPLHENPKQFLARCIGRKVRVNLKWGQEYVGMLCSTDDYFNLQLTGAKEYVEGKEMGDIGEVTFRCNNIRYIEEILDLIE